MHHGFLVWTRLTLLYQVEVNELTPSQVREEAEKLARKEVATQMAQFKEFGIMANWAPDATYRTLGKHG